jgi:lipoate-protein ligase A
MRAHAATILQHGAIVLDWDDTLQRGAMGVSDDSSLRNHVTTVTEELGRAPDRQDIETAIVHALSAELGITLTKGSLTTSEEARREELTPSFVVG